jgi:ribosomal protein S20
MSGRLSRRGRPAFSSPPSRRKSETPSCAAAAARSQLAAANMLRESQRVIDRVVAKGVLHRNAGDRHKSRLAHALRTLK